MSRPRLLITSGPTREYLDPVRYLGNGSSGQMGRALAIAALENGFDVTIVSGPVSITYPEAAKVIDVISTQEMFDAVMKSWPDCVGLIAAAAPADFRPAQFSESKIKKSADSKTFRSSCLKIPTSSRKSVVAKVKLNGRLALHLKPTTESKMHLGN